MERYLTVRLAGGTYGVGLDAISDLSEVRELRRVSGAPPGVLGVHEWRGRLLTVLDVTHFLDETAADGPASLLRLAPPLETTALYLPGPVQLRRKDGEHDERLNGRLEPQRWLDALQRAEGA